MVVCNIVTARERNSFLSTCFLYSLFLRKRFQIFHSRDNAIPLQEHVPWYHICHKRIVIPCYGRTHHIQPNQPNVPSLCPATYLLTLNLNPCVVHDICLMLASCRQLAPRLAIFLCSLDNNLVGKLTGKQPALFLIQKICCYCSQHSRGAGVRT